MLTKNNPPDQRTLEEAQRTAHAALEQIPLLKSHCSGKSFNDIDIDACLAAVKQAEGSEERARLTEIIQQQSILEGAVADGLTDADHDALRDLAIRRDSALREIGSALLRQHYRVAEEVLEEPSWLNKNLCPTCDTENDSSVLNKVRSVLETYQVAEDLAGQIAAMWSQRGRSSLGNLESIARQQGEAADIHAI
jgi:hypothetical protein